MPCNENAFQRKYVQNHLKESDKPPRLEQNLAKGTPKKGGVNQNWCWALGIKGKKWECPSRGLRSGPKYFKFCIPFVKALQLWRWMPRASLA